MNRDIADNQRRLSTLLRMPMNELYELSYVVVDDDDDDRFLMRMALQGANRTLPIFEFADGQELIDYLTANADAAPTKTCTGW